MKKMSLLSLVASCMLYANDINLNSSNIKDYFIYDVSSNTVIFSPQNSANFNENQNTVINFSAFLAVPDIGDFGEDTNNINKTANQKLSFNINEQLSLSLKNTSQNSLYISNLQFNTSNSNSTSSLILEDIEANFYTQSVINGNLELSSNETNALNPSDIGADTKGSVLTVIRGVLSDTRLNFNGNLIVNGSFRADKTALVFNKMIQTPYLQ